MFNYDNARLDFKEINIGDVLDVYQFPNSELRIMYWTNEEIKYMMNDLPFTRYLFRVKSLKPKEDVGERSYIPPAY